MNNINSLQLTRVQIHPHGASSLRGNVMEIQGWATGDLPGGPFFADAAAVGGFEGWSTFESLPGAHFASAEAVAIFEPEARLYDDAVARYAADRDADELWESLRALGYDNAEIEWHVRHRGERMQRGYVSRRDISVPSHSSGYAV